MILALAELLEELGKLLRCTAGQPELAPAEEAGARLDRDGIGTADVLMQTHDAGRCNAALALLKEMLNKVGNSGDPATGARAAGADASTVVACPASLTRPAGAAVTVCGAPAPTSRAPADLDCISAPGDPAIGARAGA